MDFYSRQVRVIYRIGGHNNAYRQMQSLRFPEGESIKIEDNPIRHADWLLDFVLPLLTTLTSHEHKIGYLQ